MLATLPVPQVLPPFRALDLYPVQEGRGEFLRMDFNEGPPPDLALLSQCLALCSYSATVYPEYGPLKRAAAQAWNMEPAMLMPVNGADEGIAMTLRAFTGPGEAVAIPVPCFPMYRIYAAQYATPVVTVPMTPDFDVDVRATIDALEGCALLALTSPNNPTGRAVPEATLVALLEAAEGRPVILDETYAPFCGQDFAPLLARYPNLILLRTLSKAHGLPGLRCGLIVADPRVIRGLEVLRAPFNVNGLAATLGAQMLLGDAGLRGRLSRAVTARQQLQARLEAAGLRTIPSDTHFFMADLGERAAAATAALREGGILIKDLSRTLPGMLRISVAEPSEADAFLATFLPWWESLSERSQS